MFDLGFPIGIARKNEDISDSLMLHLSQKFDYLMLTGIVAIPTLVS